MMRRLLIIAALAFALPASAQEGPFAGTSGASGVAGGDLSGSYPNPTVAKVGGNTPPTGIWKNNPPVAAVSGTDYAPATSGSAILLGNGAGGFSNYGGVAGVAHQWISAISAAGVGTLSQPACADLSNGAASCSTDTTNASNISSGTLASARGGAGAITGALKGNGSGVVSQAACADLSDASVYCSATRGQLPGTTTNDNASAGNIGEYVSSNIPNASAVSLSTGVTANVTSISITAGDWDVCGQIWTKPAGTTTTAFMQGGVTTTSATMPGDSSTSTAMVQIWMPSTGGGGGSTTGGGMNFPVGCARLSVAGTTTVYLVAQATFGVSTMGAFGNIQARRRR